VAILGQDDAYAAVKNNLKKSSFSWAHEYVIKIK